MTIVSQTKGILPVVDKKRGLYEDPERQIFKFWAVGRVPWLTEEKIIKQLNSDKTKNLYVPCKLLWVGDHPAIILQEDYPIGSVPKIVLPVFRTVNEEWEVREVYVDRINWRPQGIKQVLKARVVVDYMTYDDEYRLAEGRLSELFL